MWQENRAKFWGFVCRGKSSESLPSWIPVLRAFEGAEIGSVAQRQVGINLSAIYNTESWRIKHGVNRMYAPQ
jgi:hypothetical protein